MRTCTRLLLNEQYYTAIHYAALRLLFSSARPIGSCGQRRQVLIVKRPSTRNRHNRVQNDPTDNTRVLEIPTGKNPRGIVVNSTFKAYVMNYVSRNMTSWI